MYAPPPVYTKAARKAKVSGIMLVWVTVTPDGGARDVTIEKKLGYGLDEQTVKAVKGWRFKPATIDGKPIESRLMIEMNFKFKLN
jgi:TonB family protein